MASRKQGWRLQLFTLNVCVCLMDACSYLKPIRIEARRETTQCFTVPTHFKPLRTQCSWQISSNHSNYVVHVTVEEVTMPESVKRLPSSCLFRHVIILDGNQIEADSLGHWCGAAKQTYTTSGQHAYVYFRSDTIIGPIGFKVCYKAIKTADKSGEGHSGVSAFGMFGYVILGWIVLLLVLKLTWDRVKKVKGGFHHENGTMETDHREVTEPRIDLSIISVAPPPYDHVPAYPNEAPPPYLPRRHSQSDAISGSQHRIVLDNFILTRAPPPAYSPATGPEVHRNRTSANSIDRQGRRNQRETNIAIRMTSEER